MPLETSYFVSCDKCGNYSSYTPVFNYNEALSNLRRLNWYYKEVPASPYTTNTRLHALCGNCKNDAGEFREGDRG